MGTKMAKKGYLLLALLIGIFLVQYAAAQSGCCLNPMTEGCKYSALETCCPPDAPDKYVAAGGVGPANQGNCTSNWFYQSEQEDACATMSADTFPNAGYCMQGCCCTSPPESQEGNPFPVIFLQENKLLCLGLDQFWFDLQTTPVCDNTTCGPKLYPPLLRNATCDITIPGYCDPYTASDPEVICKNVTNVNAQNTQRGVCCYSPECAAEIVGETVTEDLCVETFTSPFNDPQMVCVNGNWVQSGLPVGAGEVCARQTGQTATNEPILLQVGTCTDGLLCKPALIDEIFHVCCANNECSYFNTTSLNGTCYADLSKIELGIETRANYTCDNGTWTTASDEIKKRHGEICEKSLDCNTDLSCLPYNVESTEESAGIKHCCLKDGTECGSPDGCAGKDDTKKVGNDTYVCIGPLWVKKTVVETPWEPQDNGGSSGGGGCSSAGTGSGAGGVGGDNVTLDTDNDTILDDSDNCINISNTDQKDTDSDGKGDVCDDDIDGDGVLNEQDNCPEIPNADQADLDNDKIGDVCDSDKDGDTVANDVDNCPLVINTDQKDDDNDGMGDACDTNGNQETNSLLLWGAVLGVVGAGLAIALGWIAAPTLAIGSLVVGIGTVVGVVVGWLVSLFV